MADKELIVRDNVTMISINNVSDDKAVIGEILKTVLQMDMCVDIVDYHNNYKGSRLTILVENSGILRVTSAVGMFKSKNNSILCDVYCLNTAITAKTDADPIEYAVKIMTEFQKNKIELYHMYSSLCAVTVVINEAYTDKVCEIMNNIL